MPEPVAGQRAQAYSAHARVTADWACFHWPSFLALCPSRLIPAGVPISETIFSVNFMD